MIWALNLLFTHAILHWTIISTLVISLLILRFCGPEYLFLKQTDFVWIGQAFKVTFSVYTDWRYAKVALNDVNSGILLQKVLEVTNQVRAPGSYLVTLGNTIFGNYYANIEITPVSRIERFTIYDCSDVAKVKLPKQIPWPGSFLDLASKSSFTQPIRPHLVNEN